MNYIDMHCDTLMKAFLTGKKDVHRMGKCRVDLEKLRLGGCKAQFFAIFMLPVPIKSRLGFLLPSDEKYIHKLCKILESTISAYPEQIALARNLSELTQNAASGKLSAFLTLEDGRAVDGKMENLEGFYPMGIRLITLTWNHPNCFGSPASLDPAVMAQGLTDFGKAAVARMNEMGMIVDVSHLSDGGFWNVKEISRKPFVASHSNCRALCPHPRNLTDDMIRALADSGGVAGLNFMPDFLNADMSKRKASAAVIARHAKHMADKGGIECVAIGTDFDGFSGDVEISSPTEMQQLFHALKKEGFHESQIEKIAYENVERVLCETLK